MIDPRGTDPVREAAAAWLERLSRDRVPAAEVSEEFERWLSTSSAHRAAYEAVDHTWSALKDAAHDPRILALRQETALRLTRKTSAAVRPLRWAAVALLALALGGTLTDLAGRIEVGQFASSWFRSVLGPSHAARYVTTIGERLNVALEDGSQVTLNTQTEIAVAYTSTTRTVHLVRGQALFEVAKNRARPFVVETQYRRFIAVGTAFDVHIDGEQVKVTMLTGTVRAQGFSPDSPEATMISAGEELTAAAHGPDQVRRADAERVTSWRRGQVIFEDTRLGDAVREINRYSSTRIELADPKLADLRLSGAFATGATDVFVEAITSYFPIDSQRNDDRTVILKAH